LTFYYFRDNKGQVYFKDGILEFVKFRTGRQSRDTITVTMETQTCCLNTNGGNNTKVYRRYRNEPSIDESSVLELPLGYSLLLCLSDRGRV